MNDEIDAVVVQLPQVGNPKDLKFHIFPLGRRDRLIGPYDTFEDAKAAASDTGYNIIDEVNFNLIVWDKEAEKINKNIESLTEQDEPQSIEEVCIFYDEITGIAVVEVRIWVGVGTLIRPALSKIPTYWICQNDSVLGMNFDRDMARSIAEKMCGEIIAEIEANKRNAEIEAGQKNAGIDNDLKKTDVGRKAGSGM